MRLFPGLRALASMFVGLSLLMVSAAVASVENAFDIMRFQPDAFEVLQLDVVGQEMAGREPAYDAASCTAFVGRALQHDRYSAGMFTFWAIASISADAKANAGLR